MSEQAETITCPRCGFTAPAYDSEPYAGIARTTYKDVPAIRHSPGRGMRDHYTYEGRCAAGGKWGIGPCPNAAKGERTRPTWLEAGDGSTKIPLCGIHLRVKAYQA